MRTFSSISTVLTLPLAALLLAGCQPLQPAQDANSGGLLLALTASESTTATSTETSSEGSPGYPFSYTIGTPPTIGNPPVSVLEPDVNAEFAGDIAYGADGLNTFDLFMPESDEPTPVVIYIHGGGFRGLDKTRPYQLGFTRPDISKLLRNGIAFITIDYRLLEDNDPAGVRKCLHDSRYALQFIRYYAAEMNIDPTKIALWGSSAGAGTSLWLALNDDMADPDHPDSIRRQSTRVLGVSASIPQTTYDFNRWESEVLIDYGWTMTGAFADDPGLEPRMLDFYAIDSLTEYNTQTVADYRSEVDMLAMVTSDDPELWLKSTNYPLAKPINDDELLHHPHFVRELVEKTDAAGVATIYKWGYQTVIHKSTNQESSSDYLIRKLTE